MGEPAAQESLVGRTIGNYEVVEKLGEGGMGIVYLALHPRIGKKVALKVLHTEFASDPSIVDRFFTEAKSVNDIGHPNIVDIIDYGEIPGEDGKPLVYLFMEFLEGESLSDTIERDAPLAPESVFHVAAQIADALGASHQMDVVHRDMKPDNIFLTTSGRSAGQVKVLDFGIAKLTGDQPGSRRTRTGVVIGTPYYMSPEQCEGRGDVDGRTDIYALGIVMYEMLTGQVPFQGEGYGEVLVKHLTRLPAPPRQLVPELSPYVEVVVLKALEKNRDDRYSSMEELHAALLDPITYVDARGGVGGFLSGGAELLLEHKPDVEPVTASGHKGTIAGTRTPIGSFPAGTGVPLPLGTGPRTPTPFPVSAPGTTARVGAFANLSTTTPAPTTSRFPTNTPVPTDTPVPSTVPAQPSGPHALTADLTVSRPTMAGAGSTGSKKLLMLGVAALAGTGIVLAAVLGGDSTDKTESANTAETETAPVESEPVETEPAAPPAATVIDVRIATTPDGADVLVGDETEPRGQTPMNLELDKGNEPITITVRKQGFADAIKAVTPDRDASFEISLTAVPTAVAVETTAKTSKNRRKDKSRRNKDRSNKKPPKDKTKTTREKPVRDKPADKKPPVRKPVGDDILAPSL